MSATIYQTLITCGNQWQAPIFWLLLCKSLQFHGPVTTSNSQLFVRIILLEHNMVKFTQKWIHFFDINHSPWQHGRSTHCDMMQLIVWVSLLNSVVFLSHSYTVEVHKPEKLGSSSGSSTNEDHVGEGIIFILVNLFSLSMQYSLPSEFMHLCSDKSEKCGFVVNMNGILLQH